MQLISLILGPLDKNDVKLSELYPSYNCAMHGIDSKYLPNQSQDGFEEAYSVHVLLCTS